MNDQEPATFSEQLRRFRVRAGLSQALLAERANVSSATVATLERGLRTAPFPRTLDALAQALGLSAVERAALVAAAHPAPIARQAPTATSDEQRVQAPQLPLWPTSFVGREIEVEALQMLLDPDGSAVRLLTLLGPGGVGKTRLAVAAAATLVGRFADGAIFVDLAPVADQRLVPATIARTIGLREGSGRGAHDLVLEHLRDSRLLLVLDNFEHLLGARALMSDLLQRCPRVSLLVTSRTPLRVQGEQRFAVAPLATPAVLADGATQANIAASPAVQLFVERAQVLVRDFALTESNAAVVADICRRLDGIPLALELAAARVPLLPPESLLRRLERRLPLLTSGPRDLPQRQQTLRTTLAWSYDLLEPAARVLFRRLAVFAGGWTFEAAEAVCADAELPSDAVLDELQVLVDSSVVRRLNEAGEEPRFGMLETVREYARDELVANSEYERLRTAHAEYYVQLAAPMGVASDRDWPRLWAQSPELTHQALDLLEVELDNFHAALDWWSIARQPAEGLRLAVALNSLCSRLGQYAVGRGWLEAMLDLADATGQAADLQAERAVALTEAGSLASYQGDNEQARAFHRGSVELWRELDHAPTLSIALANLGLAEWVAGDAERATALLEESLVHSRAANLPHTVAISLRNLGLIARSQGLYAQAEARFREALAQSLPAGWYRGYSLGRSLSCLGRVTHLQNDFVQARALLQQAFQVIREARVTGQALADCLDWQAALEAAQGDARRAVCLFGAADRQWRTSGAHRYTPDEAAYAVDLASVRAALDDQVFATAWAQGAAMQPEQAIAYALRFTARSAD